MRTIGMALKLTLAMAGLAGAPAPEPARPFAAPRLRIEPAGRVDLGELGPLEIRTQAYRVSNPSRAPIALRLLDLAPGVSVAGPALQGPIPARASASLVLRVDPEGWTGPQARNVRLGTDDPGQGAYYLPIRMTVRPDLTVDGVQRDLGDVGPFESPCAVFHFLRETGKPLSLRLVTELPPYLEGEVRTRGDRGQLAITLRPGQVRPGMLRGLEPLQVETNAPQARFDLYLEWRLHHAIEATPARLVFLEPDETLLLRLQAHSGAAFRILGADLEGDGFQLGPLSVTAAAEQTLAIRRTASAASRAMLALRCSGTEETLRVPIAYFPGRPGMDEDVMVVPNKID